ncbi:hypothetical protein SAMN05720473_101273 [Fibrobacter sp. UWB15]|uniref:hypothetical protein n=1 Tax=unclassified Fibrobacter TaxID=2634177 RepID=UPI00092155D8|nr:MULTISPECIES: hypothetical protein [unclassified Fibrobacter]PWJ67402.1 hypothetical protein BGW99_101273 [Fibrobacter sp. UWB6]SHF66584.1 hypothetical protein SAMN05720760_101238 [Fibrobacter sp. UWB8]SMG10263.1 hypothetical protein SAMN05720473_101273 [Fibrobacter sp. UWB15]
MKKNSIFATVVSVAAAMTLSFGLLACGDDSSSTAPVTGGDECSSSGAFSSGAEDPTSSAGVESSGSQPSSSGSQPASSGSDNSSSSIAGNPVQKVKVFGKCMESKGRSDIPGGDGLALPPHALMGQEDGSDKVIVAVDHVMMPVYQISGFAGMIVNPALLDSIEVMAVGDTLYVKQIVDEAKAEDDSKCVAEFHFVMKDEPAFTNATFIVVDDVIRSTIDKESYVASSSSTALSSSSVTGRSVAVPVSNISLECKANHSFDGKTLPTDVLAEPYPYMGSISRIDGLAKLTIINAYLNMACGVEPDSALKEAKIAIARSGANLINDTLFVNIDRSKGVDYTCGCNARVEFLFDGQYAGFGYTAFDNNGPTEVIDAAKDRPRQIIEDVSAQCRNSNSGDDPLTDGDSDHGPHAGDGAIPPVAYMYELGIKAQIVIETVQMPCGVQFKDIDVSVGGDTLYVRPNIDESAPQADCICSTQLDFYIEAEEAFRNATFLVFDYGWNTNPSNMMQIVKQRHVIEVPN